MSPWGSGAPGTRAAPGTHGPSPGEALRAPSRAGVPGEGAHSSPGAPGSRSSGYWPASRCLPLPPAGGTGPAPLPPPLSPQATTGPTDGIGRRSPAAVSGGAGRGRARGAQARPEPRPLRGPRVLPAAVTHNLPRSGQASHSAPRPEAVTHSAWRPPLPSGRGRSPDGAALPAPSRPGPGPPGLPPPPPLPPSLWQPRPPRSPSVNGPDPAAGQPMAARGCGRRPISA